MSVVSLVVFEICKNALCLTLTFLRIALPLQIFLVKLFMMIKETIVLATI